MSSRNVHKDKQNEVLQTRTGVIVPATRLGVRDDGLEDPDEFFASAKDTSPTTDLVGKEKLSLEKKKPNGDMLDSKRPKRNVFSSVCDDNETFIPTQTSIRNLRRQLRLKWNESTTGTNELSSVSTASQLPALPISIIKKPVILQDQDHLSDLKRNFEGDFEEEIKISSVGGSTKNSLFDHDFNHSFVEEFIQGDTSNSQIQDEIQQQSISWSKELVSRDYLITDNVMSTMKGNSRTPVPVTNNQRARSRSGSSKTPSFEIYEDPDPLSFNQDFETDIVSPITMQDDDKENYPSSRERTPTTSTRNMTVAGTKENDDESKSTSSEHVDELKQSIKKPSMEDDIDSPQEAIGFQLSTPHSSVNKKRDSTSRKSSSTNTSKPRSSGTYRSNASTEEEDETLLVSVPKPRPINRKLPMQQRDCSKEKLKNDLYNVATKIRNEQGTPKRKNPKKRFNPYATVFQSQGIPLPRTFHVIPISDLPSVSSPADNIALRRSKRAKVKPLDFWKGECIEYGPNEFGDEYEGVTNMSVPIFVRKAETTPHKPRNCSMNGSKIKSKKMNSKGKTFTNDEVGIFDDKKLRKKYNYVDNEKAEIWNETTSECDVMRVVARGSNLKLKELPKIKSRESSEGQVYPKAAHAFNVEYKHNPIYPGYIMGKLVLPPKGIKLEENVGSCAQTFTIVAGQPNSIELAFGNPRNKKSEKMNPITAQRFLMRPGDVFRVPPGNSYRLQNHSTRIECEMTWTIIRPTHPDQMDAT